MLINSRETIVSFRLSRSKMNSFLPLIIYIIIRQKRGAEHPRPVLFLLTVKPLYDCENMRFFEVVAAVGTFGPDRASDARSSENRAFCQCLVKCLGILLASCHKLSMGCVAHLHKSVSNDAKML